MTKRIFAHMMVLLGLLVWMTAPSAVADQPTLPRGDISVSFPGYPGICYTPCTVTATDTLPPEKAVNVVRREWTCQDTGSKPGSATPFTLVSTDVTATCSFLMDGPNAAINLQRFYPDGTSDGGIYRVEKRDPADAPAPVDVQVPTSIVSPRDVIVVKSPKKVMRYDCWISRKAVCGGYLYPSRAEGGLNVFQLRLHVPRGRLEVELQLSNIPGRFEDRRTFHTTVSRFVGQYYFGFSPEIVLRMMNNTTYYRTTFAFTAAKAASYRLSAGVQRRVGGKWKTLARRSETGIDRNGWSGTRVGFYGPRPSRKQWTRVRNAACEGAKYRVVASYTVRTLSGKTVYRKSLTKKLTFRCPM